MSSSTIASLGLRGMERFAIHAAAPLAAGLCAVPAEPVTAELPGQSIGCCCLLVLIARQHSTQMVAGECIPAGLKGFDMQRATCG
jgi:hypothetical protein